MFSKFGRFVPFAAVAVMLGAGCDEEQPSGPSPELKTAAQILLDDFVEFSHAPGVKLTMIDPDGIEWSALAGVDDVRTGTPVDDSMSFRVGSHTKFVVGVIAMTLVEQGLLNLDDPLTTYLPEYTGWNGVTVRMLLAMRSGIPDYLICPDITMDMLTKPGSCMAPKSIVDKVYTLPMDFDPGTDGFYSDSNTYIAALILERVTGRSLAQLVRTMVSEPLGLDDTYLDVKPFRRPGLVHGYLDLTVAGNDLTIVDPSLLSFLPIAGDLLPQDMKITSTLFDSTYLTHPGYAWAAGALVSSSHDMANLVRSVFQGNILSSSSVAEMQKTDWIRMLGYPTYYGVSTQSFVHKLGTSYGHSGMSYGYRSATFHYPETGWTYSMMCNTYPAPWMEFDTELSDLIYDPSIGPAASCKVSDKFDANPAVPEIQAKFRGRINTGDGEYVPTGFGTAYLVTGNKKPSNVTKETMFGRNLFISTLPDGRVDIRFRGQAIDNSEAFWRQTHIIIDRAAMQSAEPMKAVTSGDVVDMYVEDVYGTVDASTFTKRQIVAVIDRSAAPQIGFCDRIEVTDEGLVRGWASVPVTRKADAIAAWAAESGIPVERCPSGNEWIECAPADQH